MALVVPGTLLAQAPPVLTAAGDRAELDYAYRTTATAKVRAAAGSLVRLAVVYRSLDPDLVVVDAAGAAVVSRTTSTVANGVEPLTFVAAAGGEYEVRVTGAPDAPVRGRAVVTLTALGPVRDGDERRMAADAALDQGFRQQSEGTRDDWLRAAATYGEAVAGFEALPDPEWRARARLLQATALIEANDLDNARRVMDDAVTYFESVRDDLSLATALASRCDLRLRANDVAGGLDDGTRAVELSRRAKAPWVELGASNNLGGAHFRKGDALAAVPYARRAVDLAKQLELTTAIPIYLTNLSVLYRQLGRFDQALQYARQGFELLQGVERPEAGAFNARTTGELSRNLGRLDAAERYYNRALALAAAEGDARDQAFTHGMLAALAYDRDDLAEARTHFETSERLWPANGKDPEFSMDVALTLWKAGDLDAADARYTASEAALAERGVRNGRAAWGRGLVARSRNDVPTAVEHFRRAIAQAQASKATQLEASFREDLGVAFAQADRLDEAAAEFESAMALGEQQLDGVTAERLRIGFQGRAQRLYEAIVDVRMRQAATTPDAAELGWAAAERGRARALLTRLRGVGPVADLEARERVLELERELDELADRLAGAATPAARQALLAEWDARLADYDVAQSRLGSQTARQPETPRALSAIRASLPDDGTVIVQYALGAVRSYAWLVGRNGVVWRTLPPRADLERVAIAYRVAVTARLTAPAGETPAARALRLREARAAAQTAAREAADLLLRPFATDPRWASVTRLVVVPDGALHELPFAALPAATAGEPLVRRWQIVVAPSASTFDSLLARPAASSSRAVAVAADPVFDASDPRVGARAARAATPLPVAVRGLLETDGTPSGTARLARLPYTRAEADVIARVASPAVVVTGFEASRDWVLASGAAGYGVLHLATHAIVDPVRPELSGVVLSLVDARGAAVNGFLSLHRLYQQRLSAELVVLSACHTAVGRRDGGEGAMSLARGFMAAGVPRVLASLWAVDDQATAALMRVFYEGYRGPERLSAAAALRRAQEWMRRQPRWADPYYWAAWTLHGSPT